MGGARNARTLGSAGAQCPRFRIRPASCSLRKETNRVRTRDDEAPADTNGAASRNSEQSADVCTIRERWPDAAATGRERNRTRRRQRRHAVGNAASRVSPWQYLAVVLRLLGLAGLFVVYQTIEAEGLREIFGEVVSKRLARASSLFLGWMADFEETRKLDMANALAAAFLSFTYLSWEAVVYRLIHRPAGESLVERYLVLVPAVVLLVIDTVLFTTGVYANGSFTSVLPAVLLALGYDAMLILFSYWLVKLERRAT